MASHFILSDAPAKPTRVKKTARPLGVRVDRSAVVTRAYRDLPEDMARLAE
jgi:hypothetical protein